MAERALPAAALAALALAIALLTAVALGALHVPDVGRTIERAPERLGKGTYAFAAAMAFLELGTLLGVPLPFEVGVILSGAVAGEGEIAPLPLVAIVWLAASAGESANYWTGRRYGRPFLVSRGPRFRVTPERLARLEGHFERHGTATVIAGRFVPFVRSSGPFVAGASLMPYRRFLPLTVLGNALWSAAFCGLGYGFYRSADEVVELVSGIGLALLGLVVLAGLGGLLIARRRRRAVG